MRNENYSCLHHPTGVVRGWMLSLTQLGGAKWTNSRQAPLAQLSIGCHVERRPRRQAPGRGNCQLGRKVCESTVYM